MTTMVLEKTKVAPEVLEKKKVATEVLVQIKVVTVVLEQAKVVVVVEVDLAPTDVMVQEKATIPRMKVVPLVQADVVDLARVSGEDLDHVEVVDLVQDLWMIHKKMEVHLVVGTVVVVHSAPGRKVDSDLEEDHVVDLEAREVDLLVDQEMVENKKEMVRLILK